MSIELFKIGIRLFLVYLLESVLAGIFFPLTDNPLLSMALWFLGFIGHRRGGAARGRLLADGLAKVFSSR